MTALFQIHPSFHILPLAAFNAHFPFLETLFALNSFSSSHLCSWVSFIAVSIFHDSALFSLNSSSAIIASCESNVIILFMLLWLFRKRLHKPEHPPASAAAVEEMRKGVRLLGSKELIHSLSLCWPLAHFYCY